MTARRWGLSLSLFVVIVVVVVLLRPWGEDSGPLLPELSLAGADREVTAAVQRATAAVRESPRAAKPWGKLGMVLLANKFTEESVVPLEHSERFDEHDPRWPYLRGVALVSRSPEEAIPCFRRAVANCERRQFRSPQLRAVAQLRLAETLAANGHNDEAEEVFGRLLVGPLAPHGELGLGVLATVRGDLESAREHFLRGRESSMTRQKSAVQLAIVLRRLGDAEAASLGQQASQLAPDPAWPDLFVQECLGELVGKAARLQHATELENQGEIAAALDVLRKVARDYPDAHSWLTLGTILGRRGHHQESETTLRKCLELEPTLLRAQYYLSLALFAQGEAFLQQGRKEESQAKLEDSCHWARLATELSPGYGEAHFQLGLGLWLLGRRPAAREAFRQTVATRPDLVDGHLWLGRLLVEAGEKDEAVQHLQTAVRFAPANDPRPRLFLQQVLGKP